MTKSKIWQIVWILLFVGFVACFAFSACGDSRKGMKIEIEENEVVTLDENGDYNLSLVYEKDSSGNLTEKAIATFFVKVTGGDNSVDRSVVASSSGNAVAVDTVFDSLTQKTRVKITASAPTSSNKSSYVTLMAKEDNTKTLKVFVKVDQVASTMAYSNAVEVESNQTFDQITNMAIIKGAKFQFSTDILFKFGPTGSVMPDIVYCVGEKEYQNGDFYEYLEEDDKGGVIEISTYQKNNPTNEAFKKKFRIKILPNLEANGFRILNQNDITSYEVQDNLPSTLDGYVGFYISQGNSYVLVTEDNLKNMGIEVGETQIYVRGITKLTLVNNHTESDNKASLEIDSDFDLTLLNFEFVYDNKKLEKRDSEDANKFELVGLESGETTVKIEMAYDGILNSPVVTKTLNVKILKYAKEIWLNQVSQEYTESKPASSAPESYYGHYYREGNSSYYSYALITKDNWASLISSKTITPGTTPIYDKTPYNLVVFSEYAEGIDGANFFVELLDFSEGYGTFELAFDMTKQEKYPNVGALAEQLSIYDTTSKKSYKLIDENTWQTLEFESGTKLVLSFEGDKLGYLPLVVRAKNSAQSQSVEREVLVKLSSGITNIELDTSVFQYDGYVPLTISNAGGEMIKQSKTIKLKVTPFESTDLIDSKELASYLTATSSNAKIVSTGTMYGNTDKTVEFNITPEGTMQNGSGEAVVTIISINGVSFSFDVKTFMIMEKATLTVNNNTSANVLHGDREQEAKGESLSWMKIKKGDQAIFDVNIYPEDAGLSNVTITKATYNKDTNDYTETEDSPEFADFDANVLDRTIILRTKANGTEIVCVSFEYSVFDEDKKEFKTETQKVFFELTVYVAISKFGIGDGFLQEEELTLYYSKETTSGTDSSKFVYRKNQSTQKLSINLNPNDSTVQAKDVEWYILTDSKKSLGSHEMGLEIEITNSATDGKGQVDSSFYGSYVTVSASQPASTSATFSVVAKIEDANGISYSVTFKILVTQSNLVGSVNLNNYDETEGIYFETTTGLAHAPKDEDRLASKNNQNGTNDDIENKIVQYIDAKAGNVGSQIPTNSNLSYILFDANENWEPTGHVKQYSSSSVWLGFDYATGQYFVTPISAGRTVVYILPQDSLVKFESDIQSVSDLQDVLSGSQTLSWKTVHVTVADGYKTYFRLYDGENIANIANNTTLWDKNYYVMNDIDMTGFCDGWSPIGNRNTAFTGSLTSMPELKTTLEFEWNSKTYYICDDQVFDSDKLNKRVAKISQNNSSENEFEIYGNTFKYTGTQLTVNGTQFDMKNKIVSLTQTYTIYGISFENAKLQQNENSFGFFGEFAGKLSNLAFSFDQSVFGTVDNPFVVSSKEANVGLLIGHLAENAECTPTTVDGYVGRYKNEGTDTDKFVLISDKTTAEALYNNGQGQKVYAFSSFQNISVSATFSACFEKGGSQNSTVNFGVIGLNECGESFSEFGGLEVLMSSACFKVSKNPVCVNFGSAIGQNNKKTQNIKVSSLNVSVEQDSVQNDSNFGGVVGNSSGTLSNIECAGKIDVDSSLNLNYLGGIVGRTSANLSNCVSAVKLCDAQNVGGIVGGAMGTVSLSHCIYQIFEKGSALKSNKGNVGGLVGMAWSNSVLTITYSYVISYVELSNSFEITEIDGICVGGLVGKGKEITISSSFVIASLAGTKVGGLVGKSDDKTIISNCFVRGQIKGNSEQASLFVAEGSKGSIEYSYSVLKTEEPLKMVGNSTMNVNKNNYVLYGTLSTSGATTLTDAQMQDKSNFGGFTFYDEENKNGKWVMPNTTTGKQYPLLCDENGTTLYPTIPTNLGFDVLDALPNGIVKVSENEIIVNKTLFAGETNLTDVVSIFVEPQSLSGKLESIPISIVLSNGSIVNILHPDLENLSFTIKGNGTETIVVTCRQNSAVFAVLKICVVEGFDVFKVYSSQEEKDKEDAETSKNGIQADYSMKNGTSRSILKDTTENWYIHFYGKKDSESTGFSASGNLGGGVAFAVNEKFAKIGEDIFKNIQIGEQIFSRAEIMEQILSVKDKTFENLKTKFLEIFGTSGKVNYVETESGFDHLDLYVNDYWFARVFEENGQFVYNAVFYAENTSNVEVSTFNLTNGEISVMAVPFLKGIFAQTQGNTVLSDYQNKIVLDFDLAQNYNISVYAGVKNLKIEGGSGEEDAPDTIESSQQIVFDVTLESDSDLDKQTGVELALFVMEDGSSEWKQVLTKEYISVEGENQTFKTKISWGDGFESKYDFNMSEISVDVDSIFQTFTFQISQSYRYELTENQKFKMVVKNYAFAEGIKTITKTIWFDVEPQSLTDDPELAHFADAELTANEGTNVGGILRNAGSNPTNKIIAGEYGLLRVSLSPDYAMFDRVEITSDVQNNDIISFQQRVASYVEEKGQNVTNYYLYESGVTPITNGIVASRVSNCIYNDKTNSFDKVWFDGNLYFQTLIASTTVSAKKFTIHVAVYFRDKLVRENSLEISVVSNFNLQWSYDTIMTSDKNSVVPTAYVAIGTGGAKAQPTSAELEANPSLVNWQNTQNVFSLKKTGVFQNVSSAKIDSVLDANGKKLSNEASAKFLEKVKLEPKSSGSGLDEYYLNVQGFSNDSADAENFFENYLGYTITLTVSGFKYDENNIKLTIHRSINVVLVDFVLQNGAFYVKYGTDTTLSDDATPNSIDLPYFKNAFYKIEVGIDKTKVIGNLDFVGRKIDEFVNILNLSPTTDANFSLQNFVSTKLNSEKNVFYAKQMWFIQKDSTENSFFQAEKTSNDGIVFGVKTSLSDLKENSETNNASIVDNFYSMYALLFESSQTSTERGYYIHPTNRTTGTESLSLCLDGVQFVYEKGQFTLQNTTFFQLKANLQEGYIDGNSVTIPEASNTFSVPSISFNLTFSQQTSVDSPIPIYDETGFLNDLEEGKHYRLMADLDFSDITKYPTYTPLDVAFASFDGNGHTITLSENFNTTAVSSNEGSETNPANFGLFKKIYAGSVVKNLTLVCKTVTADLSAFQYANFGVLAGTNLGSIYNCEVKNFEKEGQNTTTNGVVNVKTSSSLNSSTYVGGLVGQNLEGSLADSLNNVGQISNSRIQNLNLVATGTALSNNFGSAVLGGFVGQNNGHIASSFVDWGIVQNNSILISIAMTGGFVGINEGTIMTSHVGTGYVVEFGGTQTTKVTQTLKSNVNAGGFVVLNDGDISDCFSAVDMTENVSEELAVSSEAVSGGFVCKNDSSGTITRSYSVSHLPKNNQAHTPFVGPNKQNDFQSLNNLNANGITESAFLDLDFGKASVKLTEDMGIMNYKIEHFINKNNRNMDAWEYFGVSRNNEADSKVLLEITNNWVFANSDTNQFFNTKNILGQDLIDAENRKYGSDNTPTISILGPQLVSAHLVASEGWQTATYSTQEAKYIYEGRLNGNQTEITYKANIVGESLVVGPRVISSAEELYYNLVDDYNDGYIVDDWYRLVSNIDLNDLVEKGLDISIFGTRTFAGRIEGNGFKINSIDLSARKDVETPIETLGKKYSTFGLFGQILTKQDENDNFVGQTYASITNLELGVIAVRASLVNYVGALAGYANNVVVSGVTLTAKNTSNVHVIGRNMVGGLFGKLVGKSQVFNVTSDLSVSAVFGNSESNTYTYNRDLLNLYGYSSEDGSPQIDKDIIKLSTFSDISLCYAGGILGVCDLTPFGKELLVLSHSYFSEVKLTSLKVTGTSKTVGTIAGGVVGLLGASSQASDLWKVTEDGAYIKGSRFAGGVVGENHGALNYARITYKQEIQDVVDASTYVGAVSSSERFSSFQGSSYAIGGVVGFNIGIANGSQAGTIKNSYSKVRVVNTLAKIAGGIVGVAVGGQFDSNFATGSVLSSATGTTGGAFGGILTFNDEELKKVLTSPFSTIKNNQFTIKISNNGMDTSYTIVLKHGSGGAPTEAIVNNKSYAINANKLELTVNGVMSTYYYYTLKQPTTQDDNSALLSQCFIYDDAVYTSTQAIENQIKREGNTNHYATKINQWSYAGMTYQVARINRIVAKNNWSFEDYSKLSNIQSNGHLGGFIGRTTQNTSDYPLEYSNLLGVSGHTSIKSDAVYNEENFKTGKVKQSGEKNFYVSKVFASQQNITSSSETTTALTLALVGESEASSVLVSQNNGSYVEYVDLASGLTRNSMYNFSYNKSKTYDRMFEVWSIYDYGTQINENSTRLSDYKITNYDAYGMPIYDPIVGFTKIQITTTDEWLAMNENPDADYQLMNDLDFSGVDYTSIGREGTVFTGSLTGLVEDEEGNQIVNTIYNIDIKGEHNGLWGTTNGAVIENLNVVGITGHDYNGTANTFGLLIGTATDTTIRNITIKKENDFVLSSQNKESYFEINEKLYKKDNTKITLVAEAPKSIYITTAGTTTEVSFKQTNSFFDINNAVLSPRTYYVVENGIDTTKIYFTNDNSNNTQKIDSATVTDTTRSGEVKINGDSYIIFQGKLFKKISEESQKNINIEGAIFEIDDVTYEFKTKTIEFDTNTNSFEIDGTTCVVNGDKIQANKKNIAKIDNNGQFLFNNRYYTYDSEHKTVTMNAVAMTSAKNQIDLIPYPQISSETNFYTGGLVGQYIGNSCVDTKGTEVELKNLVVDADIYLDLKNIKASGMTGGLFGSISGSSNSGESLLVKQGFFSGIIETISSTNNPNANNNVPIINQGGIAGMMKNVTLDGMVADVTMNAKLLAGTTHYVGGIVGRSESLSALTNIVVLGDIVVDVVSEQNSGFYVGGVVGKANADLSKVVNAPNIIINTLDSTDSTTTRWNVVNMGQDCQYVGGLAGEIEGNVSYVESVASIMNYTTLKNVNALFGHSAPSLNEGNNVNVFYDKQVALVSQQTVNESNTTFNATYHALSTDNIILNMYGFSVFRWTGSFSYPILNLELFDDPSKVECVMQDADGNPTYNFIEKYKQVVVNAEKGTKLNPKTISNLEEFKTVLDNQTYTYYIQTADITGTDISDVNFVGFYNGNGHSITGAIVSDLYGRTVKNAGLFGGLKSIDKTHTASVATTTSFSYYRGSAVTALNANYEKLAVKNNKSGEYVSVGILVGTVDAHGIVYGCVTSGNIILNGTLTANNAIGGIAGRNFGQIVASGSSADVWANGGTVNGSTRTVYVGGLAGLLKGYDIGNPNKFDYGSNSKLNPITKGLKVDNPTIYAVSNSFFTGTIRFGQVGNFVAGGLAGAILSCADEDTFGGQNINGKTYLENSYVSATAVVKQGANDYKIYQSGDSPKTEGEKIKASSIVGASETLNASSCTRNLWYDTNLQNENPTDENGVSISKDKKYTIAKQSGAKKFYASTEIANKDTEFYNTLSDNFSGQANIGYNWQANIGYNFGLCTPGIVANMGQSTGIGTESSPFVVKHASHFVWATQQNKGILDKIDDKNLDEQTKKEKEETAKNPNISYPYVQMGIDLDYASISTSYSQLTGKDMVSTATFGGEHGSVLNGNGFYIQNSQGVLFDENHGTIEKLGFKNSNFKNNSAPCYVAITNNGALKEIYIKADCKPNEKVIKLFFNSGNGSLQNSLTNNQRIDNNGTLYDTTTVSYSNVCDILFGAEDLIDVWYVKHQSGKVDDETGTGTFVLRAFDKNASKYDVFGIIGTDNYTDSEDNITLSDDWDIKEDKKGTIYITTKEQYIALVQYYQENEKNVFHPYNIVIASNINMEGLELSHLGTYFAGQNNGTKQTYLTGQVVLTNAETGITTYGKTHKIENFGLTNDSMIDVFAGTVTNLNISNVSLIASKNSAVLFTSNDSTTGYVEGNSVSNVNISHVLANAKFGNELDADNKENFARLGIVADSSLAQITNTFVSNVTINVKNGSGQEVFVGGFVAVNKTASVQQTAQEGDTVVNDTTKIVYGSISESGVKDVSISVNAAKFNNSKASANDNETDKQTTTNAEIGVVVGGLVGQNTANITMNPIDSVKPDDNVGVQNVTVSGNAKSVGFVVGVNNGSGKVEIGKKVEATINARAANVGGIFGEIRAIYGGITLKDTASVNLTISSENSITNVGGIAGIYKISTGSQTTVNGNITINYESESSVTSLGGIAGQFAKATTGAGSSTVAITITKDQNSKNTYPTISIKNPKAQYVGGLIGFNGDTLNGGDNNTDFECVMEYVIETNININSTNANSVGGLFGRSFRQIGVVKGNSNTKQQIIYNDCNDGKDYKMEISGNALYVGGIVGYNRQTIYVTSFSNATIETYGYALDALEDETQKLLTQKGFDVTGGKTGFVGGLVGYSYGKNNPANVEANIYGYDVKNLNITSDRYVGGLVGYNDSCSTIGTSSIYNSTLTGGHHIGGIAGANRGVIKGTSIATSDAVHVDSVTISGFKLLGLITGENIGTQAEEQSSSESSSESISKLSSGLISNVIVRDVFVNSNPVKNTSSGEGESAGNTLTNETSTTETGSKTTSNEQISSPMKVTFNSASEDNSGQGILVSVNRQYAVLDSVYVGLSHSDNTFTFDKGDNIGFVGLNEGRVSNLGIYISTNATGPETTEDKTTEGETETKNNTSINAESSDSNIIKFNTETSSNNVGIIGKSTKTSFVQVVKVRGPKAMFTISGNENVGAIGYCENQIAELDSGVDIFTGKGTNDTQAGLELSNITFKGNINVGAVGSYVGGQEEGNEQYNINIKITDSVSIKGTTNIGVIGKLENTTSINFVTQGSVSVNGTTNVGGLVGYAGGNISGNIELLRSEQSIVINNSETNVGGLVGTLAENYSFIPTAIKFSNEDNFMIQISGKENVGGIIGLNNGTFAPIKTASAGQDTSVSATDTTTNSFELCKVKVNGTTNVGGIAGKNTSTIGSDNSAISILNPNVEGTENVGGIAGQNTGSITNISVNSSTIEGTTCVGGFVGLNEAKAKISTCTISQGTVGGDVKVGGFVGDNQGTVEESTSKQPTISGTRIVGGAIGYNEKDATLTYPKFPSDSNGKRTNIKGHHNVGGLVGVNGGTIEGGTSQNYVNYLYVKVGATDTYLGTYNFGGVAGVNFATGKVFDTVINAQIYNADTLVGGLFGSNYASIENFWQLKIDDQAKITDNKPTLHWGGIKIPLKSDYTTEEEGFNEIAYREAFYKSIYMYYIYGDDNKKFILYDSYTTDSKGKPIGTPMGVSVSGDMTDFYGGINEVPTAIEKAYYNNDKLLYNYQAIVGMHIGYDTGGVSCTYYKQDTTRVTYGSDNYTNAYIICTIPEITKKETNTALIKLTFGRIVVGYDKAIDSYSSGVSYEVGDYVNYQGMDYCVSTTISKDENKGWATISGKVKQITPDTKEICVIYTKGFNINTARDFIGIPGKAIYSNTY